MIAYFWIKFASVEGLALHISCIIWNELYARHSDPHPQHNKQISVVTTRREL